MPEGEDQPTTDVDLFISTERLKIANSSTKVSAVLRNTKPFCQKLWKSINISCPVYLGYFQNTLQMDGKNTSSSSYDDKHQALLASYVTVDFLSHNRAVTNSPLTVKVTVYSTFESVLEIGRLTEYTWNT